MKVVRIDLYGVALSLETTSSEFIRLTSFVVTGTQQALDKLITREVLTNAKAARSSVDPGRNIERVIGQMLIDDRCIIIVSRNQPDGCRTDET